MGKKMPAAILLTLAGLALSSCDLSVFLSSASSSASSEPQSSLSGSASQSSAPSSAAESSESSSTESGIPSSDESESSSSSAETTITSSSSESHEHTFADSYEYDAEYHWHPSTCGHDVESGKERHSFVTDVTEPTYQNGGYSTHVCEICGYSYVDAETDALPITVTWKNEDGTVLEIDSGVPYGSLPTYDGAEPEKESDGVYDYSFAGWEPEVVPAVEDATYTATFRNELITYRVDFDLDGGSSASYRGPIDIVSLDKGAFFFDCAKEGWTFRGWEYDGEKIFDEKGRQLASVDLKDGMVFKAVYSKTVMVSVTSNIPEAATIEGAGEYPYDSAIEVSIELEKGYDFLGWYDGETLLSSSLTYRFTAWNEDVELEARFEESTFAFRAYSNNDECGLVLLKADGNEGYRPSYEGKADYRSEVEVVAFSKSDVRFLGWYEEDGALVSRQPIFSFSMPNRDYELEARWDRFPVVYELNGGENDDGNPSYYSSGEEDIVLKEPTREGYSFLGWKSNGEFVEAIDTSLLSEVELEAVWSPYEFAIVDEGLESEHAAIVSYDETADEVEIPSFVLFEGREVPVTEIGAGAFENHAAMASIVLPETILAIDERAFAGCSSLASIFIREEISAIGKDAFLGASDLIIYCEAPSKPSAWDAAWNPDARPVAYGCSGGGSIDGFVYAVYEDNGRRYASIVDYSLEANSVEIPETIAHGDEELPVESINERAFAGDASLVSISLPSSLKTIGNEAFEDCSSLASLSLPSSLASIGESAFEGCSSLHEVAAPASLSSIGSYAFQDCEGLERFLFEEGSAISSIEDGVFMGCSSLVAISLPSSVSSIGEMSFAFCESLESVELKEGSVLLSIGGSAFEDCSSLLSFSVPSSVTAVDVSAFAGCDVVTIFCEASSKPEDWNNSWNPDSRPVVWGCGAGTSFEGLGYALRSDGNGDAWAAVVSSPLAGHEVRIPESVVIGGRSLPVREVADAAFQGNYAIEDVYIPSSVVSLGVSAFQGCHKLKSVSFEGGDGLVSIADFAFEDCTALLSFALPASVSSIGQFAFSNCTDMKSFAFPSDAKLASIGAMAFAQCTSLASISLPSSVIELGDSAFQGCGYLTSFEFAPDSALSYIDDNVFTDCFSLQSISIPASVTSIGNSAFYGCYSLTSVVFAADGALLSIKAGAFRECSKLTSLSLPSSLSMIEGSAFQDCVSLESIEIPSSVGMIGNYAFAGCSTLEIYCEAETKPASWAEQWNPDGRMVHWGVSLA